MTFAPDRIKGRAWFDPRLIRLRCTQTGHYMHMSGTCTTANVDDAWLGNKKQGQALRKSYLDRCAPWTFIGVRRTKPYIPETPSLETSE